MDALTARYLSTNHPILTTMLGGYLPAALVMVQRSGRRRLLDLAEHHERAMPR
ncbi:hypothetical protein AB0K00_36475 [Dactylosporangium sp. NPDC049525]|uniref:hypothetical protein n=1 Tax=Dactylosporangium sp. NPDC049525 TaxID=3154730 RepID=UPI0034315EBB